MHDIHPRIRGMHDDMMRRRFRREVVLDQQMTADAFDVDGPKRSVFAEGAGCAVAGRTLLIFTV